MIFTIEKNDFQDALALTGRLAGASLVPEARVRIADGKMAVTATNLGLELTAKVPVEQQDAEDGEFYVGDAKVLMAATEELPDGKIRVSAGQVSLTIDWPAGSCTLPAVREMAFPPGLHIGETPEKPIRHVTVPAEALVRALKTALPFLAEDQVIPVLGSVLFDMDGKGKVTIVGTDRQVLVTYGMESGNGPQEEFKFLLPMAAAAMMVRILDKKTVEEVGNVILHCDGVIASVSLLKYDLVTRCLDVPYPPYRTLVDSAKTDHVLGLKRTDLVSTIRRVAAMTGSRDEKDVLVFDLKKDGDTMMVSAQSVTEQSTIRENVACHWDGPDMKIGFHIHRILELASGASGENVTIGILRPDKAATFTSDGDGAARSIVMPCPFQEFVETTPKKRKKAEKGA